MSQQYNRQLEVCRQVLNVEQETMSNLEHIAALLGEDRILWQEAANLRCTIVSAEEVGKVFAAAQIEPSDTVEREFTDFVGGVLLESIDPELHIRRDQVQFVRRHKPNPMMAVTLTLAPHQVLADDQRTLREEIEHQYEVHGLKWQKYGAWRVDLGYMGPKASPSPLLTGVLTSIMRYIFPPDIRLDRVRPDYSYVPREVAL